MGGVPSRCVSSTTQGDIGVIIADFNGLPVLPLDKRVPSHALKRRGAISGASEDLCEVEEYPKHTYRRRGAISYNPKDDKAVYIRHLGDALSKRKVKASWSDHSRVPDLPSTNGHISLDLPHAYERRGSLQALGPSSQNYRKQMKGTAMHYLCVDGNVSDLKVHGLLQAADMWDFDLFALRRITEGRPLFFLGLNILQKHKVLEHFGLDYLNVIKFLSTVEGAYHSENPYHNCTHAADVLQALHCLLIDNPYYESLTPAEVLAALLAAITHDVDHPGVNQNFLINTSSYLYALHGDHSLLERHHIQAARGIIAESGLLSHLCQESRCEILDLVDSLILATDINRHKLYLSELDHKLKMNAFDVSRASDRQLFLEVTIKCADISNPCRPWRMCKVWCENIMEEFFRQGDLERSLNLPISFLCDRRTILIPQAQKDFIDFVVRPQFLLWQECTRSAVSSLMLSHLSANQKLWDELAHRNTVVNSDESTDSD